MSGWRRRWAYLWELASEREAATAEPELDGGRAPARSGGRAPIKGMPGAPLTAPAAPAPQEGGIQRQPLDAPRSPTFSNPVVLRESVRVALMWHHRAQRRPGDPAGPMPPIALTPELEEQLMRLMPTLDAEELRRLWDPPPTDWAVALHRFTAAGHLPRMVLPEPRPQPGLDPHVLAPLPPGPEREREGGFSPFGAGMVGLHFRVNPRRRALPEENIAAALRGRGLRLRESELKALLTGRRQGVEQIEKALGLINTGLDPAQRRRIAETIADVLLDRSLEGQLERELPTGAEREQERQRVLEPEGPGGLRGLVERLPVGASITFHFP